MWFRKDESELAKYMGESSSQWDLLERLLNVDSLSSGFAKDEWTQRGWPIGTVEDVTAAVIAAIDQVPWRVHTEVGADGSARRTIYCYERGLFVVTVGDDGEVNVQGSQTHGPSLDVFKAACSRVLRREPEKASISILRKSGDRIMATPFELPPPYEIERGNYGDATMLDVDHVIGCIRSGTPCGRLVLFDGIKGTGKTTLVRGLAATLKGQATLLMVPPAMVPSLQGPDLVGVVSEMERSGPLVLIIEDADHHLLPRAVDNGDGVSSLLSIGDGILGAALDLRVICTTNTKIEKLDQALTRPMRLCRAVKFEALRGPQAREVFKRLTGKDSNWPDGVAFTLAEIYKAAQMQGWVPTPVDYGKLGFANGPKAPIMRF